jgi:hypothetical protein
MKTIAKERMLRCDQTMFGRDVRMNWKHPGHIDQANSTNNQKDSEMLEIGVSIRGSEY